ncbi:hypothetical protein BAUCODRAFT_308972 [Baudoinia panamericana UAMH 10762]|uniref:Uncharacterized protein n=1 Tax=Baudoinia panamericana (strain UAMH 10762) TaxID=717646 RepID=M2MYX6_BAUPA|nr:uncharacterized protein BAUCODRAFT_308972 [Baudoinia panamericana UAMH 10762]EMC91889.1 hypothetical protein BAUCODRAFT_308972 [Baudoinia panamericana UAMH 10762]
MVYADKWFEERYTARNITVFFWLLDITLRCYRTCPYPLIIGFRKPPLVLSILMLLENARNGAGCRAGVPHGRPLGNAASVVRLGK